MARGINRLPSQVHQILKKKKGYSYPAILKITQREWCNKVFQAGRCENCQDCEAEIIKAAEEVAGNHKPWKGQLAGFYCFAMRRASGFFVEAKPQREQAYLDKRKVKVLS